MRTNPGILILTFVGALPWTLATSYYPSAPVVYQASPSGAQAGSKVQVVLEGLHLTESENLIFNTSQIKAKILETWDGPNGRFQTPLDRMRLEVEVQEGAPPVLYGFRVKTPHGAGNWIPFAVGRFPEVRESAGNDRLAAAHPVTLPVTVNGAINEGGEEDYFQFEGRAGDELVVQLQAHPLGSRLDGALTLLGPEGHILASSNNSSPRNLDAMLGLRLPRSGRYTVRVTDFSGGGGARRFYRLTMGPISHVTHLFPTGVRRGEEVDARLEGFNLGDQTTIRLRGDRPPREDGFRDLTIRTPQGPSLSPVRIAMGNHEETLEQEENDSPETAQQIPVPVTVNGRIGSAQDADVFRFRARRGRRLALEVAAQRLDSPLDSYIEVLDIQGNSLPRALLRTVFEGSHLEPLASRSLQLQRFALTGGMAFGGGDFVLLSERELVRLEEGLRHSDDFSLAQGLLGQRLSWLGTSPQNHPRNYKARKVEILSPETPVAGETSTLTLYYRNDDGGPVYGKDSYLLFDPPADGEYLVHLRDLRGSGGRRHTYRLTVRPARPDFRLYLDDGFMQQRDLRGAGARSPNVPLGGSVPLVVSALRIDGFRDEIRIEALDLPSGIRAEPGTIRRDEFQTTLIFTADSSAPAVSPDHSLKIQGRASVGGEERIHPAVDLDSGLNLVSLVPPATIRPLVEPNHLVLRRGAQGRLRVRIDCPEDFAHEVGIEVKNRPPGLFVDGRSTNAGLVISKGEHSRTLNILAEASLEPMTVPIYVVTRHRSERTEKMRGLGILEESVDYASQPILVTIE
jgi:hypothetical protein